MTRRNLTALRAAAIEATARCNQASKTAQEAAYANGGYLPDDDFAALRLWAAMAERDRAWAAVEDAGGVRIA